MSFFFLLAKQHKSQGNKKGAGTGLALPSEVSLSVGLFMPSSFSLFTYLYVKIHDISLFFSDLPFFFFNSGEREKKSEVNRTSLTFNSLLSSLVYLPNFRSVTERIDNENESEFGIRGEFYRTSSSQWFYRDGEAESRSRSRAHVEFSPLTDE